MINCFFSSWLLLYYFFAFVSIFLSGEKIGTKGTWVFIVIGNLISIFSIFEVIYSINQYPGNITFSFDFGSWIIFSSFSSEFSFVIDLQTMLITQLVITVSFVTQIYGYYYIQFEPGKIRFQAYLNLFTFFILILVNSDNLILFFIGWEGVGLCSYLLIGFWGQRSFAGIAALKAVSMNRIGDIAYILSLSIIISFTGLNDFETLTILIPFFKQKMIFFPFNFTCSLLSIVCFFFAIAAMVKSAQFGFHGWLADAMEGPTPVSALIHAATMVTAGIYLLIKISFMFIQATEIIIFIAFIGGLTAFFGASVAFFQWDVKKVIAYSTCSQLGYIFCSFGVGGISQSFFHLVTHGYFKALLFFTAGIVIHNFGGEQDIRKIGNLGQYIPLSKGFFFVGLSALIGLPGISGFFSKEGILDVVISDAKTNNFSNYCFFIMLIALIFTVFYSIKLIYYVYYGKYKGTKNFIRKLPNCSNEVTISTLVIIIPLIVQSVYAQEIIGAFFMDMDNFGLSPASIAFTNSSSILRESISTASRYLPGLTIFSALFFFFKFRLYIQKYILKKKMEANIIYYNTFWVKFFQNGWIFDSMVINIFISIFKKLIFFLSEIEKIFGELFTPIILENTINSWIIKIMQFTGFYSINKLFMSISIVIFFIYFFI